jgi:hypothetical protein
VRQTPLPPSTKLRGSQIPPALDALVLRCLAKETADRYQTGAELRRDLMKVRAILFTMSDSIVGKRRQTGAMSPTPKSKLTEGWSSLGGKVPELLAPVEAGVLPEPLVTSTSLHPSLPTGADDPERIREEYREVLRELAMMLVKAVLAPPETSEILERLLVAEEEIASLTGTIALSEQNFDRIRFEYSQREKRLRYAILDLSMEQAKLKGLAAADPQRAPALRAQVEDLEFQIGELTKRCKEMESERNGQIQELDSEVKRYRETRKELEEETANLFQNLHSQVEALRQTAQTEEQQQLYARLDGLRGSIEGAAHSS